MRVRVTAVAGLATAAGLGLAALALLWSLRAGLIGGIDDVAQVQATAAVGILAQGGPAAAVAPAGGDSLVQVLDPAGRVLAASPALPRVPLVALPVTRGLHRQPDVELAGRRRRVLSATTADGTAVVVVSSLHHVRDTTRRLVTGFLLGGPLLLALICAAVWLLTGYTLRTVEHMRVQVARLSTAGLAEGIDVPPTRDEIHHLAVTMNDLLARIHRAVSTQRRFVADAAHELRNPLAALQARIEVNQRLADPDAWRRTAPDLAGDTARLAVLVEDLLALARLDESPRPRHAVAVDLDEIVHAEAARLRRQDRVRVHTTAVSPALVHGDPALLTRVVANLLANAVRHADASVHVTLRGDPHGVELTVTDDGPGIPPAERERVFGRFYRLDEARARDSGGSGLGLAIVREAVRAHGGSVAVADTATGATLLVRLPPPKTLS